MSDLTSEQIFQDLIMYTQYLLDRNIENNTNTLNADEIRAFLLDKGL